MVDQLAPAGFLAMSTRHLYGTGIQADANLLRRTIAGLTPMHMEILMSLILATHLPRLHLHPQLTTPQILVSSADLVTWEITVANGRSQVALWLCVPRNPCIWVPRYCCTAAGANSLSHTLKRHQRLCANTVQADPTQYLPPTLRHGCRCSLKQAYPNKVLRRDRLRQRS